MPFAIAGKRKVVGGCGRECSGRPHRREAGEGGRRAPPHDEGLHLTNVYSTTPKTNDDTVPGAGAPPTATLLPANITF